MIHYLLLFQFALLYWVTIILGLIVYGSDFSALSGKMYLVPLLVIPLLHRFHARFAARVSAAGPATVILLAGALLALLAYRPLHFAFWDEHNTRQAWLLSLLAVFSYLACVIASVRIGQWQGNHQRAVLLAWLVLGVVWMMAVAFPMISLLALAIILLLGVVWYQPVSLDVALTKSPRPHIPGVLRYLLFLLILDLGLVIWDYQVNSDWAWHLAGACIAAALGHWLSVSKKSMLYWPVIALSVGNFITAILWPGYVIQPLHSAVIGVCLGWVIGRCLMPQDQQDTAVNPAAMISLAFPLFMGLTMGYLFYANLSYGTWRTLLLVPLLALLLRSAKAMDVTARAR